MQKAQACATILFFILALIGPISAMAQTVNLDDERAKTLKELSSAEIQDPKKIELLANEIFKLPVQEQQEEQLKKIAATANLYANLVGYISGEYDTYKRENFQYKFITQKIEKPNDQYAEIGNKFKDIRNLAYFNLGIKARDSGKKLLAFLYFRDVFRLASFDCGKAGAMKCPRWSAEQEMKKLLNLPEVNSYVSWQ